MEAFQVGDLVTVARHQKKSYYYVYRVIEILPDIIRVESVAAYGAKEFHRHPPYAYEPLRCNVKFEKFAASPLLEFVLAVG